MPSREWRNVEQRLVRERHNQERCDDLKVMLKEQGRQAAYGECDARVEAMRRQRAEALERQEKLSDLIYVKSMQEKENRKHLTQFEEQLATQLANKRAQEARHEVVRQRAIAGSEELRILKEKLHAAQINKVRAKQLVEKQERAEIECQREAAMAADIEDRRQEAEEANLREMQQKVLRQQALRKHNQDLMVQKNQEREEAVRQFEQERRLVEEVVARIEQEDRQELAAREGRKKSMREMLMQYQQDNERRRIEEETRQAEEEERIEAFTREKRLREERLAQEKREHDAEKERVYQEMMRQQGQRMKEAEDMERLREDLWREEKEEADRRRELMKARKRLEDKREMLQAYQEHLQREEVRRRHEAAKEQEEKQMLMAKFEEDQRLDQLSAQKRRARMQEYRREVDRQMEERRLLYEAERQKERDELARMKAEEAEEARIVEEERQKLLQQHAGDVRHFPKGALIKDSDYDAVGMERPRQPTPSRSRHNNYMGIPPFAARAENPVAAFRPPVRGAVR
eukprot:CAMPEP_0181471086 /NCGR_PEP_ID=MMETSP1110-20121109/38892_1 /TAXON_ID=174948 /ORGANISM="Symbiodinium sp., Strain CCMP421" /LENGTH=515 /DNA_ID=CAMNT_0023596091 /DNA_START=39 /DNA_END=1586 /DNA_ORIENTATION=+